MTAAQQVSPGYQQPALSQAPPGMYFDPAYGRVAGRDEMGIRQVLGFFLCGGLVWGFFVWLFGKNRRSAGDLLAGTVVLHDPDGVLALSTTESSARSCALRRIELTASCG
jgi:hypothetical protein